MEIPIKLDTFFKVFGLREPPPPPLPPPEIQIPSVGGEWIFSGTAHYHHQKGYLY